MTERKKEEQYYVEVNFDLGVKECKEHYATYTNKHWRHAWSDVKSYLKEHGFEHTLYSGYVSEKPMNYIEATKVFSKMNKDMPWVAYCAKGFRMTKADIESVDLLDGPFKEKQPLDVKDFEKNSLTREKEPRKSIKNQLADAEQKLAAKEQAISKVKDSGLEL